MNLKSNLERAAGELMAAGVPEPDLDAWYLLEYVTGVSRAAYFADPGRELTEAQQEAFDACVKKRVGRIPLQHITGTQEFMGLSFRVNEHVLIPRQDTEILVEEALEMLKKRDDGDPGSVYRIRMHPAQCAPLCGTERAYEPARHRKRPVWTGP